MDLVTSSRSDSHGPAQNSDPYFAFIRAERTEDREASYRVRYQVYCIERGFLDPQDYPRELEHDAFDAHSLHLLASHRDGAPAGTARLILHSPLGFPLVEHCEFSPTHDFLRDPDCPTLSTYAEISRLAVSKAFRRREGDTLYGGPSRPSAEEDRHANVIDFPASRAAAPVIVTGIYRLLYQESKRRGITHWVVAMETSLYVILRRMGFIFNAIGPKADYFGPVRPYVASIQSIDSHLYQTSRDMLRYLAEGLEAELLPSCLLERDDEGEDEASIA
jgi:N-acyl amino acid synthase of PEP-CTERM/exosortase system